MRNRIRRLTAWALTVLMLVTYMPAELFSSADNSVVDYSDAIQLPWQTGDPETPEAGENGQSEETVPPEGETTVQTEETDAPETGAETDSGTEEPTETLEATVTPEPTAVPPAVSNITGDTAMGMVACGAVNGTYIPKGARPTLTLTDPATLAADHPVKKAVAALSAEKNMAARVMTYFTLGSTAQGWKPDGMLHIMISLNEMFTLNDGEMLRLVRIPEDGETEPEIVELRLNARGSMIRGYIFDTASFGDYAILQTYAAQADAEPETVTVTFLGMYGTVVETREVAIETAIGPLPEAPAVEGYAFQGWMWEGAVVTEDTVTNADMVITASYMENYPATVADAVTDEVAVHVEVPAGSLPADAMFRMHKVDAESYRGAVEYTVGGTVGDIVAVDMTFVSANNPSVEYQPLMPVTVNVTLNVLQNAENLSVVHISDNGEGEIIASGITGTEFSFEASSFSIYAIIGTTTRLKYVFHNGDNIAATEYVKQGENLYDPGIEIEYGQTFIGWAFSPNETDESKIYSISQLNQKLNSETDWSSVTDLQEIDVYAIMKDAYYLRYMTVDDHGSEVVLKTVSVRTDETNKNIQIDYDFTGEEGQTFEGWIDVSNGELYEVGETLTLDHHIDLYSKVHGRNWLVFDANAGGPGSGATYTPPQLLIGEATTTEPANPTRKGYSFQGWYTNPQGTGTRFQFGRTISDDTVLYARWTPDNTEYYVIFWRQKASDEAGLPDDQKQYDYIESVPRSALTDSTVTLQTADKMKETNNTEENKYLRCKFNVNRSDAQATVNADGTTILNVYYDRNEYTLTFQAQEYEYTSTTSNNGTQYGLVNGQYVELTRHGWYSYYWTYGDTYSNEGPRYTGTRYTRSGRPVWTTIHTITALYDSDIHDKWSFTGTNGVSYPTTSPNSSWTPQNSSTYTARITSMQRMPGENITFHLTTTSNTTRYFHYYVEALPEDTNTRTYNGTEYVLRLEQPNDFNIVYYNDDFWVLEGFTRQAIAKSNNQQVNLSPYGNVTWTTLNNNYGGNDNHLYFYYSRNKYTIHYISQGPNVTERSEKQDDLVYYEAKISPYGLQADGSWYYEPTNGKDGYYFAGWYEDEACTVPYNFNSKMPANDITVYAKWDTQRVRVVLVPTTNNLHNHEVQMANNQGLTFRLDYKEKVSDENIKSGVIKRSGYRLVGWYTSPTFEEDTLWNFSTEVTKEVPAVNMNYQNSADWTNNTYGDNDGAHENVRGILKLYAKWELTVDENSVYVEYDVPEEYCTYDSQGNLQTTIPVDETAYVLTDNYITTTVKEAPTHYADGFTFAGWQLLNSDGSEASNVNPFVAGSTYTIGREYIEERTITDDYGRTATIKIIHLKAKFDTSEENVATMVTFDGNGGVTNDAAQSNRVTEAVQVNKTFTIPESGDFVREGYTQVGWSFNSAMTAQQFRTLIGQNTNGGTVNYDALARLGIFEMGQTVAADNEWLTDINNWGSLENTIYAVWEINAYTVTVKKMVDGVTTDKTFGFTASASEGFTLSPTSFSLGHNGTQEYHEIPYGTVLTFTETPASGFSIQSVVAKQTSLSDKTSLEESAYIDLDGADGKSYTIKGDTVITYTNEKAKEQKLRIHKVGDDAAEGLAGAIFSLTSIDAEGFTDRTGLVSMDNSAPGNLGYLPSGDASDAALFTLPVGNYTLTETNAPQYYDGLSGPVTLRVLGDGISIIRVGTDGEAPFDGASISGPDNNGVYTLTVTNTRQKATVTITKTFEGITEANIPSGFQIAYTITETGKNPVNGTLAIVKTGDHQTTKETDATTGSITYSWTITDAPVGAVVSATESGYENSSYKVTPGTFTDLTVTEAGPNRMSVTNKYESGSLTIRKVVTGTENSTDLFAFTATVNGKLMGGYTPPAGVTYNATSKTFSFSLTAGGSVTLPNLPPDAAYTVTETSMPNGYTLASSENAAGTITAGETVSTFTNHYETVDIRLMKTWDDQSNRYGLRPTASDYSSYLTLAVTPATAGTVSVTPTVTDNEDDTYTVIWAGLPKYMKGSEVSYSISERSISEYTAGTMTWNAAEGYAITNTLKTATLIVKKTVLGVDEADRSLIPETFSFEIINRQGNKFMTSGTVAANGQTEVQVPLGRRYAIQETGTADYGITGYDGPTVSYDKYAQDTGSMTDGSRITASITNTYTRQTKKITTTKEWADENNQDGRRDSVTLVLSGTVDGVTDTVWLTEHVLSGTQLTTNSVTFKDIVPVYYQGKPITYSVTESGAVDGKITLKEAEYTVNISGDADNGFIVTNSHTPEKLDIVAQKVWMNGEKDISDTIRNAEVTFTLQSRSGQGSYADVTGYKKTLKTEDTASAEAWEAEWMDLPRYRNGKEVTYRVVESGAKVNDTAIPLPETATVTVNSEDYRTVDGRSNPTATVTFTNTLPKTEQHAVKNWDDAADPSRRPESVTFTLSGTVNETDVLTGMTGYDVTAAQTVTADTFWKADWADLPVYDDTGAAIDYNVAESDMANYKQTKTYNPRTLTWTITNTLKVGTIEITKEVVDQAGTNITAKTMPTYHFTVERVTMDPETGEEPTGPFRTVEITGAGTVKIKNVPLGTYIITETDPASGIEGYRFVETVYPENAEAASVTISADEEQQEVTVTNKYVKLVPVTVTKTFIGITEAHLAEVTEAFQIGYTSGAAAGDNTGLSGTDDAGDENAETTAYSGTLTTKDEGVEKSEDGMTYTWTVADIPVGTVLTFSESGYAHSWYEVTTTPAADETSGKVSAAVTADTDKTKNTVVFINEYQIRTVDVTLEKLVTGNMGNPKQEFSFTVTAVDGRTGEPATFTVAARDGQAAGTPGTTGTFVLMSGEAQKLEGIPYGATVTVRESNADGYTTTATSNSADMTPSDVDAAERTFTFTIPVVTGETVVPEEGYKVTVTNHQEMFIPPTGIDLENRAWMLMMGLALIGLAGMLLRRKAGRRHEFLE